MKRTEFERVTPESVGISSKGIMEFVDQLESGYTHMHGLMIMRHGKVCCEGWWAPFAPGLHHMCNSLTKTYMGTAIGIAYTEGLLKLDDRLIDIFPEFTPEEPSEYIDELTVRNVLTMGTGMRSFPSMEGDWVKNFIAVPMVYRPGTAYFYNSVGSTFLGKIIEKLTGMDVYEYLNEKLFPKIGIDPENIDHGIAPAGKDMWAWRTVSTTEDNLRLMMLYKNGGVWDGERILAEDYVKLATTNQNDSATEAINNPGNPDNYVGYGYQIWMCQYPGAYRADGAGGQFSIVIPDKDMIVSINENAFGGPQKTLDNVWNYLMPAVMEEALPEDPENAAKLSRRMKHLAMEAPEFHPYAPVKEEAEGIYVTEKEGFGLYCTGMMAPISPSIDTFRLTLNAMEGSIEWVCKDRKEGMIEFAMDGSRRYNYLDSPWQFATQCWANAYFENDTTLVLQMLWPENNSDRTIRFGFEDGLVTIKEKVYGPGQSGELIIPAVKVK